MRGVPIAALLAAMTLVACKGKDAALDKNLANDLDRAGSTENLALAPTRPAQVVESPIERSQGAGPMAIATTHQAGAMLHAMPHVILTPTAPMLVPTTTTTRKSTTVAPRSQAVPIGYPAAGPTIIGAPPSKGHDEGDGVDNGTGHGGWGVLRGGAIEGDHCVPPPPTSVNNPLPGIGNGTF